MMPNADETCVKTYVQERREQREVTMCGTVMTKEEIAERYQQTDNHAATTILIMGAIMFAFMFLLFKITDDRQY